MTRAEALQALLEKERLRGKFSEPRKFYHLHEVAELWDAEKLADEAMLWWCAKGVFELDHDQG